jgi:predicted CXXCH cytochrome family protein
MPARFRPGISRLIVAAALGILPLPAGAADDEFGKILRPVDHSWLASGALDIVATAPGGTLELDGAPINAEQPFPNVFHAVLRAPPGSHSLVLRWDGGKKEITFFSGPNAPADFQAFRQHPPLAGAQCTQCHWLNQRGRFAFRGGCFDCHQRDGFARIHTHDPVVLEQCGMCHNAHGSVVKAHLLYSKENACKICHN